MKDSVEEISPVDQLWVASCWKDGVVVNQSRHCFDFYMFSAINCNLSAISRFLYPSPDGASVKLIMRQNTRLGPERLFD